MFVVVVTSPPSRRSGCLFAWTLTTRADTDTLLTLTPVKATYGGRRGKDGIVGLVSACVRLCICTAVRFLSLCQLGFFVLNFIALILNRFCIHFNTVSCVLMGRLKETAQLQPQKC